LRGGFFHRRWFRLIRPVIPFSEGRSDGGCSCRTPAVHWQPGIAPDGPYITGAIDIAIAGPFDKTIDLLELSATEHENTLHFWSQFRSQYRKM
jgi:hypothetical protein